MGIGVFLLQVMGAGVIGYIFSSAISNPVGSLKNGSVFVCDSLEGVWVLVNGEKREVMNESLFDQLGLTFSNVVTVSCDLAESIQVGPPLTESDKDALQQV